MIVLVYSRLSIERGVDGVMRELDDEVGASQEDPAPQSGHYCTLSIHSDGESDAEQLAQGSARREGMFTNLRIDSHIRDAARDGVIVAPCEAEGIVDAAVLSSAALVAQSQPTGLHALTTRGPAWRDLNPGRNASMTPQRMALIAESLS
jgi:hypothetical protein